MFRLPPLSRATAAAYNLVMLRRKTVQETIRCALKVQCEFCLRKRERPRLESPNIEKEARDHNGKCCCI